MPNDPVGKLPSAKPVAAPAKGVQPPPAFDESSLLKPMDVPGLRRRIYDNVYDSLKATPPVENTRYRLKLDNLQWADPEDWSPAHQKKTFFQGGTMARRLHGDWVLEDVPTNKEVSRKRATVAAVPHLNNRGLFLINGSHWSLSSQTRLDPGMYPRVQANGDIEAYVNPKGGRQHRLSIDPASNQFHMEIGQAKVPLLPILRSLGIEDKQLNEAWGNAILAKNAEKDDPAAVKKLIGKLYDADRLPEGVPDRKLLEDKLHAMKFDPYITNRTLGASHDHYNADAILNATKYLIAMNRGEKPASERDHQAFQHIVGQEHLFGEKAKNIRPLLNQLLWKATGKGNLDHVPSGYLNHHLAETITGTGLGINAQMTNPAEMLDSLYRVTKMGTGGISSLTAVPDESRNVSSSQFHFIDPVVTPESGKAGVDLRFGAGTARDKEGKLYSKFYDPTGRPKWMTPRDTQGMTIGSWESRNSPSGLVPAIKDGVMQRVPKSEVSVWSPPMEHGFSPVANLIPFKSASPPQRAAMGARMTTQALPLIGAESPHVQSGHPEGGSYESHYGQHFGALRADKAGRVTSVSPESVKVRYQDGTQAELPLHKHELYDHSPGRKTHFTQTPTVKAGDIIQPGQLLAHSNYTDKEGNVALGLNARTAWLPARGGGAFEDAFAVSESFAQRMMSDHMAMHSVEDNEAKYGKKEFRSLFPTKYEPKHLLDLDDNGVVKPGTIVKPGQPLILASRKMQAPRTTLVRSPKPVWQDVSEVWDHDYPGEVVDAIQTKNGWRVSVKSAVPMQESDKMCYSDDTEVLTADGWKNVKEVGLTDSVASLDQNGEIEYLSPVALHRYPHNDKMYSLETTQTSLLVTTNHKMYVNRKYAGKYRPDGYRLVEAGQILGKVFKLKRNGKWKGKSPDFFEFPAVVVKAGQSGNGERIIPAIQMPVKTYLMLLGMFLSEGNPFCEANGNYGIDIHQIKPENRSRAFSALDSAGVKYTVCESKIRIYSLQLYTYFDQFGYSWEKFIPNEVFNYSSEDLETLYEWMMWGDGHVVKKTGCHRYTTTSRKLADDFQRLALHLGISANIDSVPASSGVIKGKEYDFRPRFDVSVYQHKNEPEINYAYGKRVSPQKEGLVDYSGDVYCVTLPRNHVLYVRRKDKPVWCGNSGRHGNKGIVTIVPDHEMPVGEDGKPFEVLVSPYTLNSRKNDSQIAETILAKIAAKTGKKYAIPDFHIDDLMKFAKDEAKKNQVGLTETVYDPVTKTKVPGVMTGSQYFMKLHHSVECYDDQTEVLTKRGWISWGEAKNDDLFATVDGDKLVYETPLQLVKSRYSGPMTSFSSCFVDYSVTPNHRMWMNRYHDKSGEFRFEEAGRLHGARFRIRQFGFDPDTGSSPEHIVIDGVKIHWDDYAELVGWWVTEGFASVKRSAERVVIYQSKDANPSKFRKIELLVERLGFRFGYHRSKGRHLGLVIYNKALAEHLHPYGSHCQNKRLPRHLLEGSVTGRRRLFEAMISGDGSIGVSPMITVPNVRFHTTSKGLADDFQELCLRIGLGAVVRACRKRIQQHYLPAWRCCVAMKRTVAQVDGDRLPHNFSITDYDGYVYCAHMRTGLLYVRRNGKPMLCGNSKIKERDTGGYDSFDSPARGGEGGAKRMALSDTFALLAHRACFMGTVNVYTEDGPVPISKIVSNRLPVKVVCANPDTGEVTHRQVTNWFCRSVPPEEIILVETYARSGNAKRTTNSHRAIRCTRGHQFYTPDGKTHAGLLKPGDSVLTPGTKLEEWQKQFVFGNLMGDGYMGGGGNRRDGRWGGLANVHGHKQVTYLHWKFSKLLNIAVGKPKQQKLPSPGSNAGFTKVPTSRFTTRSHTELSKIAALFYGKPGGKKAPPVGVVEAMGWLGIGVWFGDDGSCSCDKQGVIRSLRIHTCAFSPEDTNRLAEELAAFTGLPWRVILQNGKYPILTLGKTENINKFRELLAPYLPPSLAYKLRLDSCGSAWDTLTPPTGFWLEETTVKAVGPYVLKPYEDSLVYDITVEDLHNYVVHGVLVGNTDFLRGTKLVRGQRNEHWWEATMSGFTPPTPDVPTQYKRFMHGLTASGINPINENGKIRLMALTDDAVGRLAEDRELQNPRGIDWSKGGDPVPGGLFDRKLHGEDGSRYSKISLFEPLPNPSFEDPVRYTLGLTEKQMRNVIAGKGGMIAGKYTEPKPGEEVPRAYQTGPKALHDALKAVDVDKELQKADDDINGTRKTKRDAAIRRRKYLQGAKDQGIHPSQWMLSKVPVLPPKFRPISKMQGSNTELVSDPNYLYSDLFNANKNLQSLHGKVSDLSEERLALYDSLKAVTGLGDPINPKTQQKNVKGMLKLLLAESPKWSIVQHKLLSSPVDLVGRSTVSPDANLDMDEIGIPKSMANKVYSRFVIKRLVRGGMSPVEAVKAVNDSAPEADRALAAEMKERPVSYHRAPVLHKYGHIGAWPKIVKGDGIRVSPFVIKGLGMDFDGDTANIHVPVYPNEVRDIVDKMMPSKNLLSAKDFAPHYKPEREFHVGLWQATQQQEGRESPRERVFEDSQALRRAFERGEVSIHDKVVVMKH